MISIITIGVVSVWSVTSVTGSVTYFCASRRRIEQARSRRQNSLKDKSNKLYQRHERWSSIDSSSLKARPQSSPNLTPAKLRSLSVIRHPQLTPNEIQNHPVDDEVHDDDKEHNDDKEQLILYKLQPDNTKPAKVINVLDTESNTIKFRFVKPSVRLHSDNLFWIHDYYFENLNHPSNNRVASVYNANVGNGGYVEILTNNPSEDQNDSVSKTDFSNVTGLTFDTSDRGTLNHKDSQKSLYQSILIKFNLSEFENSNIIEADDISQSLPTRARKISSAYERRLSDISGLSDTKTLDFNDHTLKTGEKVHVSSKLTKNFFEFKLQHDKNYNSYRWNPSSGHLKRVDRKGNMKDVANIIRGDRPHEYLIEIDQAKIDPTVALCTSLIIMNKI